MYEGNLSPQPLSTPVDHSEHPHKSRLVDKVRATARSLDAIDHLGPEAVVSFVDGEMSPKAMQRVRAHMAHCAQCRAEVHKQFRAVLWVRNHTQQEEEMHAPQDLLARLNAIGSSCDIHPRPTPALKIEQLRRAFKRSSGVE